jgi:hypothetical protein
MIDPSNVPPVEKDEILARYILQSSHIRPSNQTVKPDAFIPHPHPDLSVTRHLNAAKAALWAVGEQVAASRGKPLYGRGDFGVATCIAQQLVVKADPIAGNSNHANVTGWPRGKPAQKIIALEIAAAAKFVAKA